MILNIEIIHIKQYKIINEGGAERMDIEKLNMQMMMKDMIS